jgi:uncharacterized membrane protein YbhN (UPF0104 family)
VLNRGAQARRAYHAVGLRSRLGRMTAVTAAGDSGNKITKSGGLVGLTVFLGEARRRGHAAPRVTAAYALCTLSGTVSVATVSAVVATRAGGWWAVATAVFIAGVLARCIAVRRRGPRADSFFSRRVLHLASRIDPGGSTTTELHDVCKEVRRKPSSVLPIVAHAMMGKLLGATMLAVVFATLGIGLPVWVALQIYVVSLVAAGLGPLPGGMGAAEASITALLVARGVDSPAAMTAAMVFRFFDLWLPLAAGGLVSLWLLRGDRATRVASPVVVQPALVAA